MENLQESQTQDRAKQSAPNEKPLKRALFDYKCLLKSPGFATFSAPSALLDIHNRKDYSPYKSFADLCRTGLNFTPAKAYQDIASVKSYQVLMDAKCPIPENERQVRGLTGYKPEDQIRIWNRAHENFSQELATNNLLKFSHRHVERASAELGFKQAQTKSSRNELAGLAKKILKRCSAPNHEWRADDKQIVEMLETALERLKRARTAAGAKAATNLVG